MESSSNISLGKLIIIVLASVLPLLAVFFIGEDSLAYGVYVDDKLVGYIKNKEELQSSEEALKNILTKNAEEVDKKITFEKVFVKDEVLGEPQEIEKNIMTALDSDIYCYNLTFNSKTLGTVMNMDSARNILNRVIDYYIKKNEFPEDKVEGKAILNKLNLEKVSLKPSQIPSEDTVYKNILVFNESTKDEGIKVQIKVKEKSEEKILPPTVIRASSELFKGEEKVQQQGEEGVRKVVKEVTFINNARVEEKILEEKILTEPKEKVVLKGSKNPIEDKVAFLDVPTRGAVTSGFGVRWGQQHNGIDIAGNTGDPIKAALDGDVIFSGWIDGYGNIIKLSHGDGIETYYGHCSSLKSKVGDKVNKGEVIAYVGSTGRSTGPHVHFELRVNGIPQNPANYIK